MQRLPDPTHGCAAPALLLRPELAGTLLAILLEEGAGRAEQLQILLKEDADFCQWVQQRAAILAEGVPLAGAFPSWLADHLLEILRPLSERMPASGTSPAVGQLQQLIKRLLELDRLQRCFQEALEREKLAALKQLAYGASHEINNPLANISTRAQTLLRDETDPERRRKLATINSQAFRAHEMIADLMLFVRPSVPHYRETDIVTLVDKVVAELREQALQQGTNLRHLKERLSLTVVADPDQLAVALKALCINALEALGAGGEIHVEARVTGDAVDPLLEIQVRDSGPGISAEVRRHLFDPFYSGREAGRGLGLGLSKAWRIVQQHHGRIDVDSEPGFGATFIMRLPTVPPKTQAA